MKKPSLFEGIVVAIILSLLAIALNFVLTIFIYGAASIKIIIATLSVIYISYLLRKKKVKTGGLSLLVVIISTLLIGAYTLSAFNYIIACVLLIWFSRSVLSYSSFIATCFDFALCTISFLSALGSFLIGGSVFNAIWCFFLTQALFVFIPSKLKTKSDKIEKEYLRSDKFQTAQKDAEDALKFIILKAT